VATGPVRLEAQGSLLSTDSSLPAVTGSKLKLIAGGMLGSEANPFLIAATGIVDANAQQDLFLSQTAGDLQLGQVIAGGAASLQATGSILDGQVTNRENINGFGSNGTGWTSSVAGTPNAPQVSVVNDVTTFSNPANPGSATSASNFSMLFRDQTVNLAADWIIGFVYQSTGTQGGLSLTMNNGSSGAPLPTAGVGEFDSNASFVMNLPGHNFGDILANNVGFLSPVTFNMEEPTPLNLSSGHPIKVILSYSVSNQLLSAQLTDQTTGGQFVLSTPFNLIQALGTTLVRLSLQTFSTGATNLVQTVSNFVVLDGAANISAETLNASAGGGSLANTNAVVGSATTPLNLLVEEDITIIGPGGVNLLQMAGDLVVGSITANSSSTVSLAAPLGSIVGSVSAPGVMGVQSTSPVGTIDLKAGAANLSALGQIGTASTPLETQLAELSAVARLSRLHVNNRGALVIPAGSNGVGVAAGTTLQVTTSNALTIDAGVQAIGDVVLTVADLGLTHQSLIATPHARITSQTGTVGLFAPDALQLQPGSRIAVAGTGAGPQVTAGLTRFTPGATDALIQSLGQIVADRVSLAGGDRGTLFEVAHSGLMGQTRAPTVSVSGNTGIDRLVIHHRDAATGQSFTVSDSLLANPLAGYSLTSLDSVLLELGNFTDSVIVDRLRQLRDVEVRGFAGDDQFLVRFAPGSASRVVLDGGLGTNRLTYDGAGQALWVKPGVVQSLTSQVQHSLMQSLVPLNTPSLNGTPVRLGVDIKVLLAGLPPTQRYVEATFLQLVQRRPTSAELTKWTQSINVNPNDPARRLSLVNFLFDSDEGRTVQLQAWFQTFVGREATAVELVSWLKQYRAIKDPLVMQRSFLSSSVVVQYIQSLSTTGTAEQRYVEGVLRLMNDPGLRLTPADLQSWMTLRNRLGRTDFLAYLQKQPAYLQSQQEAFTEVLANANSQFTNLLIGAPKFTSHIDMWKWLLARRTV
jgi:hypothetical protein